MHTFETPGPTNLRVELGAGECHIRAEQTDTTTVELVPTHVADRRQESPPSKDVGHGGVFGGPLETRGCGA